MVKGGTDQNPFSSGNNEELKDDPAQGLPTAIHPAKKEAKMNEKDRREDEENAK